MTQDNDLGREAGYPEIQAATRRLEEAGPLLRNRPLPERVAQVGRLFDHFGDVASNWHRALRDKIVETSGFSRENVAAGLELALKDWSGASLDAMVHEELEEPTGIPEPHPIGHSMTSIVLAGAIPMPNLLNTVLPLLVGSPVLVKPSSRDPGTPELVAQCLSAIDPELGRCIEVLPFPSHEQDCMKLFLASPCVMASGSDETIEAIRHQLSPHQSFVAYGHKFSVAVVDSSSLRDPDWRNEIAQALAIDVALWDQLGCLSLAAIYVLGRDADETRLPLLEALAEKLAERARKWPRGETTDQTRAAIKGARDEAEMRASLPGGPDLRASPQSDWTVIAETSPAWRSTPLHRFVRLYPVRDRAELCSALEPMGPHLSSAALCGVGSDWHTEGDLAVALQKLGFSRLCAPGRLQAPSLAWHHDGRPLLKPLLSPSLL